MWNKLMVSGADGGVLDTTAHPWSREQRGALKRRWLAGELDELTFEATVYRDGPNRNFVRFLPHDLPDFAEGFAGVPFLRNHRIDDIGARDGVVEASRMVGNEMRQRILLTTARGIQAFLEGVIDRFSIGWYYGGACCSICGGAWPGCEHVPGQLYGSPQRKAVCEVIFLEPQAKETSAVNTPAVAGTQITGSYTPTGPRRARESALYEQVAPGCNSSRAEASFFHQNEGNLNMNKQLYLPNGSIHRVAAGPGQAAPPLSPTHVMGMADSMSDHPEGTAAYLHNRAGEDSSLHGEVARLRAELHAEKIEQMLARSGLGEDGCQVVRIASRGQPLEQIAQLIDAQLKAEAAVLQREIVRGIRPVTEGDLTTTKDHFQAALNWMFGSRQDATPPPSLRRIGDLYQMITGDFNWYGTFNPEFSQLAAASSSTLAGMVVDALNRVVQQHYDNMMVYRWFEPVVSVVPHSGTTHDVNLIMVDGMSNLPTVGEGAAYTEANVGDSRETMAFVKRGHYVGITLEAIRKSDIQRIQAIPREMVKSSVRTRSAAIAGIFTVNAGVGPTLAQDSTALFHVANHGNLDTAAFDAAGWAAARGRIWKQQIPGTGRPLGLWPTFGLFPIDLFDAALTQFGYGAGDIGKPNAAGTAQTVNPYGESRPGDPRPIPIAVPDWTDTNDWAYIVDPRMHPVIHMAYANNPQGSGHPAPEIFEATSETQGLMFTNDTLPVKVRDWWAYGVATYVGIGKNNVAGGS